MRYAFHPDAEAEYLEAIAFYETRRAGLGVTYLAEFERAMGRICDTPHRYPVERPPNIRATRLQRFPFKILYRDHGDVVQVLAVAHDRRRPMYWLGRI